MNTHTIEKVFTANIFGNQCDLHVIIIPTPSDVRWQLIQKICASSSFQKSARVRDLLCFLAERTLCGQPQDLTEHNIGCAVFGKPESYSIVEDSSVRVHVRQLRLKLHEYFGQEGRNETISVDIPKGAYNIVFSTVEHTTGTQPAVIVAQHEGKSWLRVLPWALAAILLLTTLASWVRHPAISTPQPPWPLTTLFEQGKRPVQVVVADIGYGMTRLVDERQITLGEYLSPTYTNGQLFSDTHSTAYEARVANYLSASLLTSYADLVVVASIQRMSGNSANLLVLHSAREMRPREFEDENFILTGSPSSNPWVYLFQDKLNFQEREGVVGDSRKFFENLHPKPGEQRIYQGLEFTGGSGEDYATISLLPIPGGRGKALIIQGLQQDGTEAAGLFLADAGDREKLQRALGINDTRGRPVYFEALIRTKAVAGAPSATSIVATRLLSP